MTHSRFVLAFALSCAGCSSVRMDAPEQFVELENSRTSAKFVASDDAQLWVRSFRPESDGDLAFWRDHVKRHFTLNRGYTLMAEKDVTLRGEPAVEFTFEATVDGLLRRYALFVCVDDHLLQDRVVTAEYIGTPESFAAHEAAVRSALDVR